jgi:hypothetical protein
VDGAPGYSIDCRAFDGTGAATTAPLVLALDDLPLFTSVAALSNGNFVAAWDGRVPATATDAIRSAIVKPDCTVLTNSLAAVSTVAGTLYGTHAATSGNRILYTWVADGNLRARLAGLDNAFVTADSQIITQTATEQVAYARTAALPGGNFAVFVRWTSSTAASGPGRIDMDRTNSTGAVMGAPTLVTTRSGSDERSNGSFGVTAHADGSIFVAWSSCLNNGDDSGCGVFGRLMSPAGATIGGELSLATTTQGDQTGPSVVALPGTPLAFATAWTDRSQLAPDTAGAAVRARIIYPSAP